jgi:hypothetical protein
VKAPPAEKPAATAFAAELAAVGVNRPPPTVELKPMKAPAEMNLKKLRRGTIINDVRQISEI